LSDERTRRIAVIATIVVIPLGAWAIHDGGAREKLAAMNMVSAAAAAHGCKLDDADLSRLVTQYRDQNNIGWSESGSTVARNIVKSCPNTSSS